MAGEVIQNTFCFKLRESELHEFSWVHPGVKSMYRVNDPGGISKSKMKTAEQCVKSVQSQQ